MHVSMPVQRSSWSSWDWLFRAVVLWLDMQPPASCWMRAISSDGVWRCCCRSAVSLGRSMTGRPRAWHRRLWMNHCARGRRTMSLLWSCSIPGLREPICSHMQALACLNCTCSKEGMCRIAAIRSCHAAYMKAGDQQMTGHVSLRGRPVKCVWCHLSSVKVSLSCKECHVCDARMQWHACCCHLPWGFLAFLSVCVVDMRHMAICQS